MFQVNTSFGVILRSYFFSYSATLAAATYYSSPLFPCLFPHLFFFFCRLQILELEEEKGWEQQEVIPGGENLEDMLRPTKHLIWLLHDHCLNAGVFSNSHRHQSCISTPAPVN